MSWFCYLVVLTSCLLLLKTTKNSVLADKQGRHTLIVYTWTVRCPLKYYLLGSMGARGAPHLNVFRLQVTFQSWDVLRFL